MPTLRTVAITTAVVSGAAAASALLVRTWVRRRERTAITSILDALVYVTHRHRDHTVRDPNPEEPYINHNLRVAKLLAEAGSSVTHRAVLAAILHNAIIDTRATRHELQSLFDSNIADTVAEVYNSHGDTNDPMKLSKKARLVLAADYIENIRDIVSADTLPAGWDRNTVDEFFANGADVLQNVRGTNPHLESAYVDALKLYSTKFKHELPSYYLLKAPKAHTSAIYSKKYGVKIGSVDQTGEAYLVNYKCIRISKWKPYGLKQSFAPSFFKAYTKYGKNASGVGHEVAQQNQAKFLNKKCWILPLKAYQVWDKKTGGWVEKYGKDPYVDCISFCTRVKKHYY